MDQQDVDKLIAEWEHSADREIAQMFQIGVRADLDDEELRRALERAHPHLSSSEIDAMLQKLRADLKKARAS